MQFPHKAKVGHSTLEIPLALSRIKAGFPSPADDYLEQSLDIGRYLVKRPKTTFFMRVSGNSMIGLGIDDGDLLVIDRAEQAKDKSVVVARVGGEFTCKQLRIEKGKYRLCAANDNYPAIEINEGDDVEVWGVVLHAITDIKGTNSIR